MAFQTTPAAPGLARFQKSITTKRPGTCHYCGKATQPGIDYAALDNGKWIAVCNGCANSVVSQAKGLLIQVQNAAVEYGLSEADQAAISAHAPANLVAVLAGEAHPQDAVAAVVKLGNALAAVRTFKPVVVDDTAARLQALLAGTTATAWERDFAASIIDQINRGRSLSDKQTALVARVLDTTPATPDTCTPVDGGIYLVGDVYYRVHASRSTGNLYTYILASAPVAGCKLDWQYNPGGIKVVRRSGRAITAAEAAALGHVTSHCCYCDHELRDEGDGRSVAVGYGPVCANNRGLPWG